MKVDITVLGPISARLGLGDAERATFEEEIREGETVESLVRRLAVRHRAFGEVTFSPGSEELIPTYRILVNDSLVPFNDWSSRLLKHGDRIVFRRRF